MSYRRRLRLASFLAILWLTIVGIVSCRPIVPISPATEGIPLDERFYDIPLLSAKGISYQSLQRLLAKQQWQDADRETLQRLLELAGQAERGWLSAEDVQNLPCLDLQTLDQLWMRASQQRFGFTVQARLWETLGGTGDRYDPALIERLGDMVGWRQDQQWKTYETLTFDLKQDLPGHLPATTGNGVSGGVWGGVASLAARLQTCGIVPQDGDRPNWMMVQTDPDLVQWQLENDLANQHWVRADWHTLDLLKLRLQIDHNDDLSRDALKTVPCAALTDIDRLWTTYSNGKFGFSVQQSLMPPNLRAQGDRQEHDITSWNAYDASFQQFMDTIGWNREDHHSRPDNPPPGFYPFVIGYNQSTDGSAFNLID
jgi:hypothetical protein